MKISSEVYARRRDNKYARSKRMAVTIKAISISGYRSCVRTKFDPHEKLSALIGRNGSGKSSILNGIHLLGQLGSTQGYLRRSRVATLQARFSATFLVDGKEVFLKAKINYSINERSLDEVILSEESWNFKALGLRDEWIPVNFKNLLDYERYVWHFTRSPKIRKGLVKRRLPFQFFTDAISEEHVPLFCEKLDSIHKFLSSASYYSASQFTDPTRCPPSFEIENESVVQAFGQRNGHSRMLHDIYKAYQKRESSSEYQEFRALVGSEGLRLIDDLKFEEIPIPQSRFEIGVGGRITKQEVIRTLVVPSIIMDETRLSPSQLSEGTFKTLALMFYLVSDKSNLLLIEEPEVCIHHGLLKSVMELINAYSTRKQIMISTHSDFVLDSLDPENVFLVKKIGRDGTKIAAISKAFSKTDFRALHDYLAESGNLGEYWRHGGFEEIN